MSHVLVGDLKKKATPVTQACRVLGVSRSGYYSAAKSALATPKVCAASVHLKAAFAASGRTYGSRRLCAALQMAIAQRNPGPGLVVHSDRGTQYASSLHQALLAHHGLIGSMSRKGNCWDNAVMERFFLNLKMERVWQKDYANHAEAITDIADYIVNFYNALRLHSTLGNLSPSAFEQQSATKKPIELSEIT